MPLHTTIIGIDCATQEDKVGIALGAIDEASCRIEDALVCTKVRTLESTVTQWIPRTGRVLLALDAPLGWPMPMGIALNEHAAGQPISRSGNFLFRRETDRFIKNTTGQQSLDVGADRIARTAVAALTLIQKLREAIGEPIPLAWTPAFPDRVAAIEVYPAATLKVRGVSPRGYKTTQDVQARRRIISSMREEIDITTDAGVLERYPDALDAVVCVCAAMDFLSDNAVQPSDQSLAVKEGWIWVRRSPLPT
jgi:hypothetical protein